MKEASFNAAVQMSTHRYGRLTTRVYDPEKGRNAATAAANAMSDALDKIGAKPGDTVEIMVRIAAK